MSEKEKDNLFSEYEITFRNPNSFHLFHKKEGITKELVIETLRNITEYKEDPRKLRKNIRVFYSTTKVTKTIRLTILFQILPNRLHVLNAFLGSFHYKNLEERIGLKGKVSK